MGTYPVAVATSTDRGLFLSEHSLFIPIFLQLHKGLGLGSLLSKYKGEGCRPVNSSVKTFANNIIIKNRSMTTFIYIPGWLEQVANNFARGVYEHVFHDCICIVTIWK